MFQKLSVLCSLFFSSFIFTSAHAECLAHLEPINPTTDKLTMWQGGYLDPDKCLSMYNALTLPRNMEFADEVVRMHETDPGGNDVLDMSNQVDLIKFNRFPLPQANLQ